MSDVAALLKRACCLMEDSDVGAEYMSRHGVRSAAVLTIVADELGAGIADMLAPRIAGKTIVEIGGGIGLLAFHLARHARRVYCIEANPLWSSAFVSTLFARKPRNVSYLFGVAEEFAGDISGDVAVFATHSGVDSMHDAGLLFCPIVIDIYGEMIAARPEAFDPLARAMRPFA